MIPAHLVILELYGVYSVLFILFSGLWSTSKRNGELSFSNVGNWECGDGRVGEEGSFLDL